MNIHFNQYNCNQSSNQSGNQSSINPNTKKVSSIYPSNNSVSKYDRDILVRSIHFNKELSVGSRRLIEDLKKINASNQRNSIISNAIMGLYEEKITPYAYPKIVLQNELNDAGCETLAEQVLTGRYDDLENEENISPTTELIPNSSEQLQSPEKDGEEFEEVYVEVYNEQFEEKYKDEHIKSSENQRDYVLPLRDDSPLLHSPQSNCCTLI